MINQTTLPDIRDNGEIIKCNFDEFASKRQKNHCLNIKEKKRSTGTVKDAPNKNNKQNTNKT